MYTLNEILTLIENEATAHLQVKQYGHGDVWEINPKELDYLVLWAIEESVVLSERTLTYNIRLLAMDRVLPGEENEQEVMSDTIQVLLDFVAYFRQLHTTDLSIQTSVSFEPFTERFDDKVSGHACVLSITQPYDYNKCQIPQTTNTIPPTVDGITLYDFCNQATLDRLTLVQIACLEAAFGLPCVDATVENSDASYTTTVASGATLVLPNITVTDSDGSTSSVPSVQDITCTPSADATVQINSVTVGTIPSGDTDSFTVNLDGSPSGSWDGDSWEVTSAVCADATVNVNGVFMENIPSGDTENIEVRQETGATLVGSKQGQYWRVDNSPISINGSPISDVKAEDSLDIDVTQDGSPVGSWNGSEWIIPPAPSAATLSIGVFSDAGLTNPITSADFSDTVYIKSVATNFTPITYRFTVKKSDGTATLINQSASNNTSWIALIDGAIEINAEASEDNVVWYGVDTDLTVGSNPLSTAEGVFSTCQMIPDYVGALANVMRASDGATNDFWADDDGYLSDSSKTGSGETRLNWLGGSNGTVTIFYNQNGDGDSSQTVANDQFEIAPSGLEVLQDSKVTIPVAIGESMVIDLAKSAVNSVFFLGKFDVFSGSTENTRAFDLHDGAASSSLVMDSGGVKMKNTAWQSGVVSTNFGARQTATRDLFSCFFLNSSNRLFRNGTEETGSIAGNVGAAGVVSRIAARGDEQASTFMDGNIQAVVIYNDDQVTNETRIRTVISNFFP